MDPTRSLRSVAAAAVWVALAAPARGQDLVLPPSHAAAAGTGSTNVPFGRSTAVRVQAVYDALAFPAPRTIGAVDLRVDEGQTAGSKRVELELEASSLGASVTRIQAVFASNRGADRRTVIARRLVDLPALAAPQTPGPFHVALQLDQPFTFDPQHGGALVLEFIVHGQAPGAYTLDATWLCTSVAQGYGPPGCGPAGGPVLVADNVTTQVTWGRPLTLQVRDARAGAPTWMLFGTQRLGVWNGITLPVDLRPIGAPGCHLSIDALASVGVTADGTGTALYSFFVPSFLELTGAWVRFQGVAADPSANALGAVTSQAFEVQICGFEPVGRVYAAGLTADSGLRELGTAPVLRLR